MHSMNTNEEMKMKYTIVWNEDKTEGIILSGEDVNRIVKWQPLESIMDGIQH